MRAFLRARRVPNMYLESDRDSLFDIFRFVPSDSHFRCTLHLCLTAHMSMHILAIIRHT